MSIICVGDSHTAVFCGAPIMPDEWNGSKQYIWDCFDVRRVGPWLAYTLDQSKKHNRVLHTISNKKPGDHVLLSFGEIDIRCHIIKQARLQKKPYSSIIIDCLANYKNGILHILSSPIVNSLLIWTPPATCPIEEQQRSQFPIVGSYLDRNKITYEFTERLEEFNKIDSRITVLSITKQLMDSSFKTKTQYYLDETHLSQEAMSLIKTEFQQHKISI